MEPSLTCRVFRWFVVFIVLWQGTFTVVAIVLTVLVVQGGDDSPGLLVVIWIGVVAWSLFRVLYSQFYEIRLYDDGRLAFRGIFRQLEVQVGHVEFIGRGEVDWSSWTIQTRRRTALMPRAMTNRRDLANRLCELNPHIDLRQI